MTQISMFPNVDLPRMEIPVPKYLTLDIWPDTDVENPADDEGYWKFISFSTRHSNYEDPYDYLLPNSREHPDPRAKCIGFQRKLDTGTAMVLSCYQHSGTAWSLMGEGMQDRWDSARIAGLLIWTGPAKQFKMYKGSIKEWQAKHEGKKPTLRQQREELARNFIEIYNEWCNGHCHGFTLTDSTGEEIESVGGYIGSDAVCDAANDAVVGFLKRNANVKKLFVTGDGKWMADHHTLAPKDFDVEQIDDEDEIDPEDFN